MLDNTRRGRPLRLPEPHEDLAEVSSRRSFAWLLAVARIHHPDPRIHERKSFVCLLRDHGVLADQSTISRWESGKSPFPAASVAAYEAILGLGAGVLQSIGDIVSTVDGSLSHLRSVATSVLVRSRPLDDLIDAILGGTTSGTCWHQFAQKVYASDLYLQSQVRDDICGKLTTELARAVGHGLTSRYAAASRLLQHPAMAAPMLGQIEAFVSEPRAQSVAGPIAALALSNDPQAHRLVTALSASDHEQTLVTAATAASAMARRSRSLSASPALRNLVIRLMQEVPLADQDFAATSLAVALERSEFTAVLSQVSRWNRDHLVAAKETGEIFHPKTAFRVARSFSIAVREATGGIDRHEPDLMLERLVREALFNSSRQRRQIALLSISNTPYRQAATETARDLLQHERPDVAARAATMIPYLAHGHDWTWILDLLDGSTTDAIDVQLLTALARWEEDLDEKSLDRVAAVTEPRSERMQFGARWVLGMHDGAGLHDQVHDCDPDISGAAKWWLSQGAAVRD